MKVNGLPLASQESSMSLGFGVVGFAGILGGAVVLEDLGGVGVEEGFGASVLLGAVGLGLGVVLLLDLGCLGAELEPELARILLGF